MREMAMHLRRSRRAVAAGLAPLALLLGTLPAAALACIALNVALPGPGGLPLGPPDDSPPQCTRSYPGNPLTPADDLRCSENATHLFNDPFFGSDLDIEGDYLYAGSFLEGVRIYSIADPARPRLVGLHPSLTGLHSDPEAARFGNRTILAFNTSVAYPGIDPFGPRAEFVDVTDPGHPRLLVTLPGDSHNGELVAERGWYLPSRLGFNHDDLSVPPPSGPGLEIYDVNPVLEDPPRRPQLIECATGVRCHEPNMLWTTSPFRAADEKRAELPARIHDISVYPDRELQGPGGSTIRRDIALMADVASDPALPAPLSPQQHDGVWIVDITDPSRPVVRERWEFPIPHLGDTTLAPEGWSHEAQFVDGDPTLMVVVEEAPFDPCTSRVFIVRMSDDLTEATTLAKWYVPPALRILDTGVWPDAPSCMHHVFSTHAGILYQSNAGPAGDWALDLRPLRGVQAPRRPKARLLQPHQDGIPWLEEYFAPGRKPELGHYIPDSNPTSWTAVYHNGLVYSSGGSLPLKPRGLDVYRFDVPD